MGRAAVVEREPETARIVPVAQEEAGQLSARAQVQRWAREIRDNGEAEHKYADVADQVMAKCTKEMLMAYAQPGVIHDVMLVFSRGRGNGGSSWLKLEGKAVNKDELAKRAGKLLQRWQSHYEQVRDRQVCLLSMTYDDLAEAATYRRQQAAIHAGRAEFLEKLSEQMSGRVTVGEMYKPEEIAEIWLLTTKGREE